METSARNRFCGKVETVHTGAVHDEVVLQLNCGCKITAVITKQSTARLGLTPGKEACALVKASNVILLTAVEDFILSTRNQFSGTVKEIKPGVVNAEVTLEVPQCAELTAIITMGSLEKLKLERGAKVTAVFKTSSVILAVKK